MAWVFDLDGVIWLGAEPIPGAAEAVTEVVRSGAGVAFVTNNSFGRRVDVEDKLARQGIEAHGSVVTSAMAVASLVAPAERVLACGGPGLREELAGRGADVVDAATLVASVARPGPKGVIEAVTATGPFDAVVVGYHRDFDYHRMTAAAWAVRGGARLLASNDDATYPTPDGPIPGGGSILAGIATAAGVAPVVAGKPHDPIADLVRHRLGPDGIVVGDRPDTDGWFARTLGYRFGLVLSGVTTAADLPVRPTPDHVAADLAALVRDISDAER
ncbi:HAD-IIA family hydrolase [Rhabdothermincola salaria]|uniref:HAD-IIA family hydrolase n=1 Tax=Rhabdothermincola salaria TaxID=2903142 RepID=UPI001E419366|nr:HAD-IIA family hydrolase [Rhabdothermincola salaria]MCD9623144.1 HAD-IIA family hydrolase [Rhabdothermincola salaria]